MRNNDNMTILSQSGLFHIFTVEYGNLIVSTLGTEHNMLLLFTYSYLARVRDVSYIIIVYFISTYYIT